MNKLAINRTLTVNRSVTGNWSATDVYDLLSDVSGYASFLPYVKAVRQIPGSTRFTLDVDTPLRSLQIECDVACNPDTRDISFQQLRGPCRDYYGNWSITPIPTPTGNQTRVTLNLTLIFDKKREAIVAKALLPKAERSVMRAIEQRLQQ